LSLPLLPSPSSSPSIPQPPSSPLSPSTPQSSSLPPSTKFAVSQLLIFYHLLSAVKKMGPLMRDLPSSMLKRLRPDEAREAVKMLRNEVNVPKSKKRVLIKQV
jgi:hypothetical protein